VANNYIVPKRFGNEGRTEEVVWRILKTEEVLQFVCQKMVEKNGGEWVKEW